jgi:GTP-binding protein HflX
VVDTSHPQYEEQIGVVNKTLQELNAFDKPILTIFNKMDLYADRYFDKWLADDVKQEILRELKEKWEEATDNNCVFVSAAERLNIDALRDLILSKVRELYKIRYPYRTVEF